MMYGDWHNGWMGFGGIWMILVWVLVIVAIVWVVRYLWGGTGASETRSSDALRLLEERYARGEIDRAEFQQKKRDLQT